MTAKRKEISFKRTKYIDFAQRNEALALATNFRPNAKPKVHVLDKHSQPFMWRDTPLQK